MALDPTNIGIMEGYLKQSQQNFDNSLANRTLQAQTEQSEATRQQTKTNSDRTSFTNQLTSDLESFKELVKKANTPEIKAVVQRIGQGMKEKYPAAAEQFGMSGASVTRQIEMLSALPPEINEEVKAENEYNNQVRLYQTKSDIDAKSKLKEEEAKKITGDTTSIGSSAGIIENVDQVLDPRFDSAFNQVFGANSAIPPLGNAIIGRGMQTFGYTGEDFTNAPEVSSKIDQIIGQMVFTPENLARLKELRPASDTDIKILQASVSSLRNRAISPEAARTELRKIRDVFSRLTPQEESILTGGQSEFKGMQNITTQEQMEAAVEGIPIPPAQAPLPKKFKVLGFE